MRDRVCASSWFRTANKVAFYAPFDGEIDCTPLLQHARSAGKACYLPGLAGASLVFREATVTAVNNRFGISEPAPDAAAIAISDLDLIFVPLVGFDTRCNRIGMGKGFYDRALGPAAGSANPVRIGLAWACQQVATITPSRYDIPMHAVATEAGWTRPASDPSGS